MTPLSLTPKTLTLNTLSSLPKSRFNRRHFSNSNLHYPRKMTSSSSTNQMFQLESDPITGKSEWIVIDDNDEFSDGRNTVDLASTSYLDMLNDRFRNRAYRLAIDKTLTRPCHVLDIGAGTGLLSMMAARAVGLNDRTSSVDSKGKVTACESYLPMVKLMRKVLQRNGMGRTINVLNKRSDELKVGVDIHARADTLVSEILDSELLGEGLIPSLQHAHDELLVENPQTVPYQATTYGQLVESAFLWRLHDLYNNEVCASDGIRLVPSELDSILRVKPQQYAMHCDPLRGEIKPLSEPFKIFEFDFWKRPESCGEAEILVKATDDGSVNAVISWWVLQLDKEGNIFYSTAPRWIRELREESQGDGDWCDHWKQCVWFNPGKGLLISKGEDVCLHAIHSNINISYDLEIHSQRTEDRCSSHKENFHLTLPPEKIATYSDSNWRRNVLLAVQNVVSGKDPVLCLVADDSVFLATVIARFCKESQILLLFPGLREKGLQYMHAIAGANGFSTNRLKLVDHRKQDITMHDMDNKKVDLLVGEPFYDGCVAQLPWKNLRFWKERTKLEGMLSKDARIMPCRGILRACAMFLPNLWRSRCSLDNIEGFDHSIANSTIGACGNLPSNQEGPIFPFFVWQCGQTEKLSESFTLMEFDFSKAMSSCSGRAKVKFINSGTCHGLVLWIDWVLDTENGILVSTGPEHRYWKQGVKLFSKPMSVSDQDLQCCNLYRWLEVEASFDSSNGDIEVKHSFVQ